MSRKKLRETLYVCQACGKRSHDKVGDKAIDRGWDVSCFLNSVRIYSDKLVLGKDGRVTKILEGGLVEEDKSVDATGE